MTEDNMKNNDLDAHFQALKARAAQPSQALLARVLADAEAEQPQTTGKAAYSLRGESRPSLLQDFLRAIGGWPAMAGLVTATVAGVWIGITPSGFLPTATSAYLGTDDAGFAVDAASDLGFDLIEEAL